MKYLKYSLLLLVGSLVLISCKKELDQQPTDFIAEENAFLTFDHIQLGANGAHGAYGAYLNDLYASALVSDEARLGAGNAGQGALEYRYQFSSDATTGGSVTASWGAYYNLIDQINRILPNIDLVTARPEQEPRRNIVRAQLLALRAISHFGLLQDYCKNYNPTEPLGVPIMTVSDITLKASRNSMGEVMAQIEKDLNDAKALLPAVTVATFTDTTINKVNLAAFQARIALYKGDYDNAITYATEVISAGVKPLVSGANFAGIWTDANFNESLYRVRYQTSTALGGLFTTTGGVIYIAPSDKLTATYDPATDIRYSSYIGTTSGGDRYVNKYYTSSRGGRIVDMKVCRISEMYLIRAEANAKKASPNLTAAAADLNAVRAARITGYVNETFTTVNDAVTAILNERFKELALEGFRFFDLKRNNLPVVRNASDASPDWQTLPAGNFRFVLPIPQAELIANTNMVQNDGY